MSKPNTLTTTAGIPVPDNQASLTAGERGPTLMQDHYLMEKLAHFNRERIPERVVHAKAASAHGVLTVTHDIRQYTNAKRDFAHPGWCRGSGERSVDSLSLDDRDGLQVHRIGKR